MKKGHRTVRKMTCRPCSEQAAKPVTWPVPRLAVGITRCPKCGAPQRVRAND